MTSGGNLTCEIVLHGRAADGTVESAEVNRSSAPLLVMLFDFYNYAYFHSKASYDSDIPWRRAIKTCWIYSPQTLMTMYLT